MAVRKAYVRTASHDGHLVVRALAWRSGYAEAAAEAAMSSYQIGVALALVG
jgi:hypothetical protein